MKQAREKIISRVSMINAMVIDRSMCRLCLINDVLIYSQPSCTIIVFGKEVIYTTLMQKNLCCRPKCTSYVPSTSRLVLPSIVRLNSGEGEGRNQIKP